MTSNKFDAISNRPGTLLILSITNNTANKLYRIQFGQEKSKLLIIGKDNTNPTIKLGDMTIDPSETYTYLGAEMAASHFLQVQVKSQVISLQVQVKSQVISVQVQVKSQVIWSDVKSSQVTSHLVQTQVKSQVSLSKYKSSRTLFLPLPA